jgi:hypothetical protein
MIVLISAPGWGRGRGRATIRTFRRRGQAARQIVETAKLARICDLP